MNIFVCGITSDTDECNTDFAMTIINLPFDVQGHNLHIHFERSFTKAFSVAQNAAVQYDRVIIMRASISGRDFIHRAIAHGQNKLVYGVYGMHNIDWQRVAQGLPGCDYNIPMDILTRKRGDDGYVAVDDKDVSCINEHCENAYDVIAVDGRILNALSKTTNINDLNKLPNALKASVYVDPAAPLTSVGRVGFHGSIAMRGQVR